MEFLKYCIGIVLIMFIILDPVTLALSDEVFDQRFNSDLLTEPIDIDYFNKFLKLDYVIDKIKHADFYQEIASAYANKEPMLPAVYSVVREKKWNLNALDEIEKQLYMLNADEQFMFCILKRGIRISNFYFNIFFSSYTTSIQSNFYRRSWSSEEFDRYLESDNEFNQPCQNIFMSAIPMYGEPLFMEHNEPLGNDEIQALKVLDPATYRIKSSKS